MYITHSQNSFTESILNFIDSPSFPADIDYLLYMDAYDSMLIGNASNIVESFNGYNTEIVVIGTKENWPSNRELK